MTRQPELCPGCGAQVHPDSHECPECGAQIPHRASLLPVIAAVCGIAVALAAGGAVWVLLAPSERPAAVTAAVAPEPPDQPAAPSGAPTPDAAQLVPPTESQLPSTTGLLPGGPAALAPNFQTVAPDAPLALPTVRPGTSGPGADVPTRQAFAKSTQDNFVQNGLDLAVTASGPDATVMTIKFNFPARTAVELIISGPFPRQCKVRGFTTIIFTDPNAITWTYDIETEKLTQK